MEMKLIKYKRFPNTPKNSSQGNNLVVNNNEPTKKKLKLQTWKLKILIRKSE